MSNLITIGYAKDQIPSAQSLDDYTLGTMISTCSDIIETYCNRKFAQANLTETFDGTGTEYYCVKNPPINSITQLRSGMLPAIYIQCNDPGNQIQVATVTVGATGITLYKLYNNTIQTNQTFTYSSYPTFGSLVAPINALGNGWQATLCTQFEYWQTSDLYFSNVGEVQLASEGAGQGAYNARNISLGLMVYWWGIPYFQFDPTSGIVTSPQGFLPGWKNYRIDYSGGYAQIPQSIQYACACLVQLCYASLTANPLMTSETLDKYSYTKTATQNLDNLPLAAKLALNQYKLHRIPGGP